MIVVGSFRHEGKFYNLFLYPEEDDRVEVRDREENILLTFTASCQIVKEGKIIGLVSQLGDHIYFIFGSETADNKFKETGVNAYKFDAYFIAEKYISEWYLDNIANKKS